MTDPEPSKAERLRAAWVQYERIRDAALDDYHSIVDPAGVEFKRKLRAIEEEP